MHMGEAVLGAVPDLVSTNEGLPEWVQPVIAVTPQSRRICANGTVLHYLCWGCEDVDRPVLLLIHGFRGHAHWWDFVAPFLTGAHRVIALDLSGMGDSGSRSSYPKGVAAQDIIGFIGALGDGAVSAIGHSAGGARLLEAALLAPALFDRLVLIDTYVSFADGDHPTDPPRLRGDRLYPDKDLALSRYRLTPPQPHLEPWVLRHIAAHSLKPVAGGWRWKFDPTMVAGVEYECDGDALLAEVMCPVHYVFGEASAIVSLEHAHRIVGRLPRGYGPIGIPGGHHHLMVDQPLALVATLRAVLACAP
jgi:pimeloyl-ACP methyl ester carboxylesterase